MSFKVGDPVKMNPKSEWCGKSRTINPINEKGIIERIDNEVLIRVHWSDSDVMNCLYTEKDLLPYE